MSCFSFQDCFILTPYVIFPGVNNNNNKSSLQQGDALKVLFATCIALLLFLIFVFVCLFAGFGPKRKNWHLSL